MYVYIANLYLTDGLTFKEHRSSVLEVFSSLETAKMFIRKMFADAVRRQWNMRSKPDIFYHIVLTPSGWEYYAEGNYYRETILLTEHELL